MTKRNFSRKAMIVIALLVFGAFIAAPAAGQAYPSGKEFYPAVYGTFTELYPNARCTNIDFYNNTYTFTAITGYALLNPISYDLKVQLKNGNIDLTYDKIYQKDTSTGRWAQVRSFGFYNWKNASKAMTDKMIAIASDPALYEKIEREAMSDIFFVHSIMKNFTELAFKDFVDNYAKGSIFNVTGQVFEVKESNRVINDTSYKYQIQMSFNTADPTDAYLSSPLGANVWCFFYTNDDGVVRLSKSAQLSIKGRLTGASKSTSSVSLTLVDAQ